jgi:hypothetical protein
MNLYLYFPHLLTEFGAIWYKSSAHNAAEHWWVSWKSAKRILYFGNGHLLMDCENKWHFEVKECSITEHIICRLVTAAFEAQYD